MTEQITGKALREARRVVAVADSRGLVAKLISTRQRVSRLQLYMTGLRIPDLANIGYRLHPDLELDYIVPIEEPKTRQQLIEEMLSLLSGYSFAIRNTPKNIFQKLQHNGRLLRRMSSD